MLGVVVPLSRLENQLKMYHRNHFSELLSLIPRNAFNEIVNKYSSDKFSKGFSSWNHLVAMIYTQLSKGKVFGLLFLIVITI